MNFKQAENYLESLQKKTVKFDLKPMQELAKALKLNLAELKVIHVAGSNGKGSTSAFASSILKESGYRTGTYTSPHLITITERIKINGKNISKKEFAKKISEIMIGSQKLKTTPSYFETITAAALKHFLDKKVDFVVAEVGMGGRLDATNVLSGAVNVITDISLEHTKALGNSILKIAQEKGAVIKQNSFTVVSKKNAGFDAIKKIAKKKNSKIISPESAIVFSTSKNQKFNLTKPFKLKNIKISLLGGFQVENATLALSAIYCLQSIGFNFSKKAIINGLLKTVWPARIQVAQKNPLIVLDSTHTLKGAIELKKTLNNFCFEKLIVVFSCLADKDFKKILRSIKFDILIVTKVDYKRALEPKKIQDSFPNAIIEAKMETAIKRAKKLATKNDLILITGSIYGAGDAFKTLKIGLFKSQKLTS